METVLKKLHAARISLPAILVSGEMPTKELNRYPWLHLDAMLPEPFTADELLATVRNVLYAIASAPEQLAPLPGWRSQPPVDALWR